MHRNGIINLAPVHSEFILNFIESAQAWKLDVQVCCRLTRCVSAGVPDGYIGAYEPQSGYLKCKQAVCARRADGLRAAV